MKLLGRFRGVLEEVLGQMPVPMHRSFADPKRRLELGDYLSLFLLGLFNPVVGTLRGLVQASGLPEVRQKLGVPRVSLGSFSEAQYLVDPAVLESLFAGLAEQLPDLENLPAQLRAQRWLARDSSLFAALPRMTWALYGGGREGFLNNAVRLHLSFDLLKDTPRSVQITSGKTCERAILRSEMALKPGAAYVGDRYFSEDYGLFAQLEAKGCSYLIRLQDRGVEPTVEEELPLSAADRQSGVQRQAWVRLGGPRHRSGRLRLIWLRALNGEILHLVTSLAPTHLTAADAGLLYKKRWQVEYFFRWVKCLLGCGHWLAESPKGVSLQLYLTLIGALLLQLDLGRRPSKRVWELLQWHLLGMVDDATLAQELRRQLLAEERLRAQKAKRAAR
ncbi:MAG TPA: IS4 family transposase [Verrucomicrobiae bacterium]|nr:IS4 family transposase [Verrucomicrobiae bacterium]